MGTMGPVVHREPRVSSSGQGMQELFSAQNEAKEDSLCPPPSHMATSNAESRGLCD